MSVLRVFRLNCTAVRRRLFAFCSGLSLLLCAAICVLWARSWRASDEVSVIRDLPDRFSYRVEFTSWAGVLQLTAGWLPADSRGRRADPSIDPRALSATTHPTELTFERHAYYLPRDYTPIANAYRSGYGWDIVVLAVPHWCAAVALAIPPAAATFHRLRRRRARRAGACLQCGYDLRATPDRCPECGAGRTPA